MHEVSRILQLVGRHDLKRWILVSVSGVLVGLTELLSALFVFVLIGLVLNPGAEPTAPLIGKITALIPKGGSDRLLLVAAGATAIAGIVRSLTFLLHTYAQQRLAQNTAARMSASLFKSYLEMPYATHLRRNSASLVRNVNQAVTDIATYGLVPLTTITTELFIGIALAGALAITSPATLVVLALLMPISIIALRLSRRTLINLGATVQVAAEQSLRYSHESLHGIRDIKILGRIDFFVGLFSQARLRFARASYLRGLLNEVPRVVIETLFMLAITGYLAFSVISDSGDKAVASLGLMAYAGVRLLPSANRIVTNVNNLQFASAAIDHIHDELHALTASKTAIVWEQQTFNLKQELRITSLGFSYDLSEAAVLRDISFTVQPGSFTAIVGSTGSGKSTLVDIMMGLLTPSHGSVTIDDRSVHLDPASWHRELGVVPQSPFLLDASVRRNVALGVPDSEIEDDRVWSALSVANLDKVVMELPHGLETQLGEHGTRLSGGQRQRVAIARAVYRRPKVLFLDEATSALDRVTERAILAKITQGDPLSTVILVSHRLSALKECDQIILLNEGRLEDRGRFEELHLRSELFRALAT